MHTTDNFEGSRLILSVVTYIFLAFVVGGGIWRKFSIGRRLGGSSGEVSDSQDDSAIIAFYTAGHMLAAAERGKIDGMNYATYLTMPHDMAASFVDDFAVIHVLDLPFNTDTHLIGLSKRHKIDRIKFENFVITNGMEKVELEGDFDDYFDLYAAKGQQIEVREVLNPKSMAYVVDYCGSHFWEINRAELYFAASSTDKGAGNIFEEAQEFVNQIKPALQPGEPGAPVVHHEVPYGEYDGPPLNCPVCNKPMTTNNLWHTCPDGHGILISGRELEALHNRVIHIGADPAKAAKHEKLICPNCRARMEVVNYQSSGIQIDSCPNCPYRWLDANEVGDLASKLIMTNKQSDPHS